MNLVDALVMHICPYYYWLLLLKNIY